ncbi:uncharacterized protein EI90DRAFT_3230801 [Cantharellus anzutake]|uniref:uncharacterized protein n=1 Tax=Cantharellus anzutake TaxID=1750568 RepID=UPI001904C6C5|nr:uncharacterized protein EI90DRAFT_3230801 [Cantharellus anzutake]KAF8307639.1 hypothetical protein EI90DRAFT_3230801 [Cantharellus anzutake]
MQKKMQQGLGDEGEEEEVVGGSSSMGGKCGYRHRITYGDESWMVGGGHPMGHGPLRAQLKENHHGELQDAVREALHRVYHDHLEPGEAERLLRFQMDLHGHGWVLRQLMVGEMTFQGREGGDVDMLVDGALERSGRFLGGPHIQRGTGGGGGRRGRKRQEREEETEDELEAMLGGGSGAPKRPRRIPVWEGDSEEEGTRGMEPIVDLSWQPARGGRGEVPGMSQRSKRVDEGAQEVPGTSPGSELEKLLSGALEVPGMSPGWELDEVLDAEGLIRMEDERDSMMDMMETQEGRGEYETPFLGSGWRTPLEEAFPLVDEMRGGGMETGGGMEEAGDEMAEGVEGMEMLDMMMEL